MRAFQSFFLGGFECSTHRLRNGKRLDLVHSTKHDQFAASDFRLLQRHGIFSAREGLRWYLIESQPNQFDFSSAHRQSSTLPVKRECRLSGTYGIMDGRTTSISLARNLSPVSPHLHGPPSEQLTEKIEAPLICPINEISFFSWAGGDGGIFNPFAQDRGNEMKRQLVRASVESIKAMRQINPRIKFFHIDPMINVLARDLTPGNVAGVKCVSLQPIRSI